MNQFKHDVYFFKNAAATVEKCNARKKHSESGGNSSENLREIWHTAPQPGQNFVCGGSGAPHSEQNRGLWVDCRGRRRLGMEERGGRHDSDTHPIPDTQTHLHTRTSSPQKKTNTQTPTRAHANTCTGTPEYKQTDRQTDRLTTHTPSAFLPVSKVSSITVNPGPSWLALPIRYISFCKTVKMIMNLASFLDVNTYLANGRVCNNNHPRRDHHAFLFSKNSGLE